MGPWGIPQAMALNATLGKAWSLLMGMARGDMVPQTLIPACGLGRSNVDTGSNPSTLGPVEAARGLICVTQAKRLGVYTGDWGGGKGVHISILIRSGSN